jgi:ATP-dependent Clp protease ATP-binding subunit ClpB
VIIFKRLSLADLKQIIKIQLEGLRKMLAERKINLVLDPSAEELLARDGFDPVFGARPLKRAIQSLLQNPLAMKLLSGEIHSGQTVQVKGDLDHSKMQFEAVEEEPAQRSETQKGGARK